jgi:hypothetical protein
MSMQACKPSCPSLQCLYHQTDFWPSIAANRSFRRCYTRFGAYSNCTHIKIIVKKHLGGKKKRKTQHHRLGTNFRACVFNAGLLASSKFASGRSCDRPARLKLSVVLLCSKANSELVPKFHVALHASHAALPMVTLNISPCTNVTLTFDFGLNHPVHGGYGRGSPTLRKKESNCQTKKLKIGHGPPTKRNCPTDRRSKYNLKLNLHHCTANYRPILSSERTPYMKK